MSIKQPASSPAQIGEFSLLRVISLEKIGAFLEWRPDKDLFLPFSEQTHKLQLDEEVVVYVYLDKADRPTASMRLDRHVSADFSELTEGQAVQVLVFDVTDLGVKAIIENKYMGLIYRNEIFKPLQYGERLQAYIKKIRDEGKIDLRLDLPGHQAANDEIGPKILQALQENNGFLSISDKSAPELIYKLFGASKKKFKIALGDLYKKRKIQITQEGIQLLAQPTNKKY